MGIVTKETLKSYFNKGDKPTETQFEDLIDSFSHTSFQEFTNITASSNISASNRIIGNRLYADAEIYMGNVRTLYRSSTNNFIGTSDRKT